MADLLKSVVINSLSVALAVSALSGVGVQAAGRLLKQRDQFEDFSLHRANCFCCSIGHVDPETKKQISCDRERIEEEIQLNS